MKALIIEDESVSSRVVERMLEPHAEQIDTASDAEEAFNLFCNALEGDEPYDLVCLDVVMPGIGGIELLQEMRAFEEEHGKVAGDGAKVLVISGACDMTTYTEAELAGCTGYLCKPLSREKLIEQLRYLNLK